VEVDAQRASLQSSLEESKHDIEVLKQTLSTLQKTNEDEKRSHEIFASDSLLLIDGAQKALEEKQR
jgi:flagellar motility protein MotE (MotC chaperone)